MVTINDFRKLSAQEYGEDTLDDIDSEDSVFLVPKRPVEDLPGLRVRIWSQPRADINHPIWTWNWRTTYPKDVTDIRINIVGGRIEHDTLHGSIAEAADAAICSINDYLENELPTKRRLEEQRSSAEQERKDRIQGQANDFLGG